MTVGHVSALGRAGLAPSSSSPMGKKGSSSFLSIQNFIQTDTVINPGNSGGPLVDLRGEVIGINSIVHGGVGGGFGFAIPADMVQRVATQIIDTGEVSRAWIGLAMSDLDYELAVAFGLTRNKGALVEEVYPGSPAEEAEVQRGDVILKVENHDVDDANDVVYRVANHPAGDVVELTIQRDGEIQTVAVTTAERTQGLASARNSEGEGDDPREEPDTYGMTLEDLDPRLNQRLGRTRDAQGVLVRAVLPGGAADRAGLTPGDVIIDVDGKSVDSGEDVVRALEAATREYVPLTIERGSRQRFVAIELVD